MNRASEHPWLGLATRLADREALAGEPRSRYIAEILPILQGTSNSDGPAPLIVLLVAYIPALILAKMAHDRGHGAWAYVAVAAPLLLAAATYLIEFVRARNPRQSRHTYADWYRYCAVLRPRLLRHLPGVLSATPPP